MRSKTLRRAIARRIKLEALANATLASTHQPAILSSTIPASTHLTIDIPSTVHASTHPTAILSSTVSTSTHPSTSLPSTALSSTALSSTVHASTHPTTILSSTVSTSTHPSTALSSTITSNHSSAIATIEYLNIDDVLSTKSKLIARIPDMFIQEFVEKSKELRHLFKVCKRERSNNIYNIQSDANYRYWNLKRSLKYLRSCVAFEYRDAFRTINFLRLAAANERRRLFAAENPEMIGLCKQDRRRFRRKQRLKGWYMCALPHLIKIEAFQLHESLIRGFIKFS